ncbi:hypothetical protein N9V90_00885 [Endozoicomonas sp.]|nr:hypothetical protein [Endozoicomonas sp.]
MRKFYLVREDKSRKSCQVSFCSPFHKILSMLGYSAVTPCSVFKAANFEGDVVRFNRFRGKQKAVFVSDGELTMNLLPLGEFSVDIKNRKNREVGVLFTYLDEKEYKKHYKEIVTPVKPTRKNKGQLHQFDYRKETAL